MAFADNSNWNFLFSQVDELEPSVLLEDAVPVLNDLSSKIKEDLRTLRDLDIEFQTGRLYIDIQKRKLSELQDRKQPVNLNGVITYYPGVIVDDQPTTANQVTTCSSTASSLGNSPVRRNSSLLRQEMFRDPASYSIEAIQAQFAKTEQAISQKVTLAGATAAVLDKALSQLDKALAKLPADQTQRPGCGVVNYNVVDQFKELEEYLDEEIETAPQLGLPLKSSQPQIVTLPTIPETNLGTLHEEDTFCICQQPSYGEMIGCDNDNCRIEWFHLGCVHLCSPPSGQWFCPQCTLERQQRAKSLEPCSVSMSNVSNVFSDSHKLQSVYEPQAIVGALSDITAGTKRLSRSPVLQPNAHGHPASRLFSSSTRVSPTGFLYDSDQENQPIPPSTTDAKKKHKKLGRPKKTQ